MHQHQEAAKDFLVWYVVEMRKAKSLKKSTMSGWLQIDPRSYFEIEKGLYLHTYSGTCRCTTSKNKGNRFKTVLIGTDS